MLAPFVFNFGLTQAAEQLCALLQLPDQECTDLWCANRSLALLRALVAAHTRLTCARCHRWGAFALAMVLSLGSAVPIVYVCRLPDCVKRLAGPLF